MKRIKHRPANPWPRSVSPSKPAANRTHFRHHQNNQEVNWPVSQHKITRKMNQRKNWDGKNKKSGQRGITRTEAHGPYSLKTKKKTKKKLLSPSFYLGEREESRRENETATQETGEDGRRATQEMCKGYIEPNPSWLWILTSSWAYNFNLGQNFSICSLIKRKNYLTFSPIFYFLSLP